MQFPESTTILDKKYNNLFTYILNDSDKTATLISAEEPNNISKDLILPTHIRYQNNVYDLTQIGEFALNDLNLTSLILPKSLKYIGVASISYNNLKEIEIPESVTKIDIQAFCYNNLTKITFHNSLTYIGDWSFFDNQIKTLQLPENLSYLGHAVFAKNHIKHVNIPKSTQTTNLRTKAFDKNVIVEH